ncbi:MAG: HEAT repeat domain-containing protein [bacterium]
MKYTFTYTFTILIIIFGTMNGNAKKNNMDKDLLQKSLVVLQQITREGNIESKAKAASVWGLFNNESSKKMLHQLMQEKNHDIVSESALALYTLGDKTGKQVLEDILEETITIDEHATQIQKFKSYSLFRFRKISAARVLGKIGDAESFRMIKTLRSETGDGQIRDGCSIALAMLGDPGERVIFENAVSIDKTTDPSLRKTAVKALGIIGSSASIGVLKKSLIDPDPQVRAESAHALGDIGLLDTAVYLRNRADDEDIRVTREVIRALGKIFDPQNLPVIEHALDSDDGVLKVIAAGSIGPYGYTKGLEYIEIALKDKDRDARLQAVKSIALISDKKLLKLLEPMLEDADDLVRMYAAETIINKLINKKQGGYND